MILTFDFNSDTPLFMQLRNQVVIAIGSGSLNPGDHLPTVRALSDESGINTMTVSKAYQLLKQEGYITTERRGGAVVAPRKDMSQPSDKTVNNLKLCISELRSTGLGLDGILDLCTKIYKEETK